MRVDTESQMIAVAHRGDQEYQPVFRDLPMKEECGSPAHSESNLKLLLKEGLEVAAVQVVSGRPVFVFKTGVTYLATGFQVGLGSRDPKCISFARILAKVFGGTVEEWLPAVAEHWGSDYTGEIVAEDRPCGSRPRIFSDE